MKKLCLLIGIVVLGILAHPARANAQGTERVVVSAAEAPVFLEPDAKRVPLRMAKAGSVVNVLGEQGEWYHIEFQDPQYGRRIGYIEKRNVSVRVPVASQPAIDVTVPEAAPTRTNSASAQRQVSPAAPETALRAQAPAPAADTTPARVSLKREGVWVNVGLGGGSAGCLDCTERVGGLSGNFSVGATLNPHWYAGVGTTGWTRSDFGQRVALGTIDARFRWFPSLYNGFFVTFGGGLGHASFEGETGWGTAFIFGAGYDFRVSSNVSVTPFYNGIGIANSGGDMNWNQLGVGITIH